jgi:hypothetical protein
MKEVKAMKSLTVLLAVIFALFAVVLLPNIIAENKETSVADKKSELDLKIKNLIKDLGADEAQIREKATKELKEIGEPAISALKEAAQSDDPEVSWRSMIILRAIERNKTETQEDKAESNPKKPKEKMKVESSQFSVIINNIAPYQSVSIVNDPSGKITVTIKTKNEKGEEKTDTYTADNIEEFRKKYPEIAKQYGLDGSAKREKPEIPEIGDDFFEDFGESWARQFERLRKQMKEMDERMKKMFDDKLFDDFDPFPQVTPKKPPKDEIKPESDKGIGLVVGPIEDALKEQLKIEDEKGVLVYEVNEKGIAEKLGFKKWDIIIKVNNDNIKNIWEFKRLMKNVFEKGEGKFSVIRKGEKLSVDYKK